MSLAVRTGRECGRLPSVSRYRRSFTSRAAVSPRRVPPSVLYSSGGGSGCRAIGNRVRTPGKGWKNETFLFFPRPSGEEIAREDLQLRDKFAARRIEEKAAGNLFTDSCAR